MMKLDEAFVPLREDELASQPSQRRNADTWTPIVPVPAEAPEPTKELAQRLAPAGYAFTAGWGYYDANKRLLGCIVRFDRPANGGAVKRQKQFLPLSFCEGPDGQREWHAKALPEPRPLYRLDELARRPDAPVLVVEGEKAVEAAEKGFPDYVVTTSSSGSNAARKADWTPLAGRNVVIWPDADAPGARYAADVADMARKIGVASVRIVLLPEGLPDGWDLADDLPPGLTDADLMRMLASAPEAPHGVADQSANKARERPSGAANAGWPDLLPITTTLPPVEPFVSELLPPALRGYVLDVADRQQAPADFAAVAAVCGLAAVLGNKIRIRPKQHDDWQVVANLWGALIGRPSAMKTPAMQAALAPVYALQDELGEAWKSACAEAKIDDELAGLDAKEARKEADKLLKAGDRDGAKQLLANTRRDDSEPPRPRLVVNEPTVEKLGELLNQNPNGLLLIRDELPGFLAKMESEEYQSDRAFYLEAFNGDGRFTYDRIGRGTIVIENCTLSISGGIQPSRLAPLVRGAVSGSSNDGLLQRFQLAVWPDDRGSWEWVDRCPDLSAKADYEQAFRNLHALKLADKGHAVLRFTSEAQGMFREWMEEIQLAARAGDLSSSLESHLLKLPKTTAGLALIFELVEGGRVAVGTDATVRALAWADYLRSHAARLYRAGETMAETGARLILERRAQLPDPFTARDIQKRDWAGLSDRGVIGSALDVLEATKHVRLVPGSPGPHGGRPSESYIWHPALKGER